MKTTVKNYSSMPCPDTPFGIIVYRFGGWKWDRINRIGKRKSVNESEMGCFQSSDLMSSECRKPMIVLVLESPHCSEFDQRGKPICPANGLSGSAIYNHFCDILNSTGNNIGSSSRQFQNNSQKLRTFLKNNQKSEICVWVVNSIQYQCSLGISPICSIIKESNWVDEWYSNRNNFDARCRRFVSQRMKSNCIFINLCTEGVYIPMKKIVGNALSQYDNCKGPHPSSWRRLRSVTFID